MRSDASDRILRKSISTRIAKNKFAEFHSGYELILILGWDDYPEKSLPRGPNAFVAFERLLFSNIPLDYLRYAAPKLIDVSR